MHFEPRKKNILRIVVVYIVILFFFPEKKIVIPLVHLFFFLILFFLYISKSGAFFFDNNKGDRFKKIIYIFIALNILSYITGVQNIPNLMDNYAGISGYRPVGLYWKVALNGIFSFAIYLFAYNFGRFIGRSREAFLYLLGVLVLLCTFNAIANIYEWLISTGGNISRYNFIPTLVPSQGISAGYSVIGFILVLSVGIHLKWMNRILRIGLLLILGVSVIIIVTRQAQVSLIAILILYYFFKVKKFSVKVILKFLIIIPLILFGFFKLYSNLGLSGLFYEAIDSQGYDYQVRLYAIHEAYRLFIENIFFGVGFGMYVLYSKASFYLGGEYHTLASTHNGLASVAAEMGVFGVVITILLMVSLIQMIYRTMKNFASSNHLLSDFVTAFLSINVIYMISFFFSNFYLLPPPSEYSYYAMAFIMWTGIGFCSLYYKENVK